MSQDKLSIELPGQQRSQIHWHGGTAFVHKAVMTDFFDLSSYLVRNFAQRNLREPKLRHASPIPTEVDKQVRLEGARGRHSGYANLNDTLPKHRFLKQLRLEKRRTERSKAPLSIMLFRFDSKNRDELGDVKGLLNIVHNIKRETDILGYLSEDLIALLLPDTTAQGTQAFTQKINSRVSALHFSTISVGYPDQLFEYVLTEHQDPVNSHLFFLGDPEPGHLGNLLKRSVDIVGSFGGILILSPLMLSIAAAIKMTSPGPVIFKQAR